MGLEALAAVLARVAVAILQWWAGREDIKRGERQRLLNLLKGTPCESSS